MTQKQKKRGETPSPIFPEGRVFPFKIETGVLWYKEMVGQVIWVNSHRFVLHNTGNTALLVDDGRFRFVEARHGKILKPEDVHGEVPHA